MVNFRTVSLWFHRKELEASTTHQNAGMRLVFTINFASLLKLILGIEWQLETKFLCKIHQVSTLSEFLKCRFYFINPNLKNTKYLTFAKLYNVMGKSATSDRYLSRKSSSISHCTNLRNSFEVSVLMRSLKSKRT